ncbi:MAG: hypothetical protein ACI8RD_005909 [Bacillariaceae sp.]|jgi:hypothetical protein
MIIISRGQGKDEEVMYYPVNHKAHYIPLIPTEGVVEAIRAVKQYAYFSPESNNHSSKNCMKHILKSPKSTYNKRINT